MKSKATELAGPATIHWGLTPFDPLFRNPHLATLAGNFWRRRIDEDRFPTAVRTYETEPGIRIVVEENRPAGASRGEVVLQHGLEGSSRSGYLISMAQALCEAGFAAHRVNMRGCGGSEALTPSLYHSGLTHDLLFLLNDLRSRALGPRFLCGYSLGGNVVLKLAGELGGRVTDLLSGIAAVSTPIDLAACVQALGRKSNYLYARKFVRSLKARYLRRHSAFPGRFPLNGIHEVRTIFEFDDAITAKSFGFETASRYYATQSSGQFVPAIRVPALIVQAMDDPMIPFGVYREAQLDANPAVTLMTPEHGGHLGFIARGPRRFWLDSILPEWFSSLARNKPVFSTV